MSEVLRFACPNCHAQLAADHGYAAHTAPCPDCGLLLILPGAKVPAGRKVLKVKPSKSLSMPSSSPASPEPSIPPAPDPFSLQDRRGSVSESRTKGEGKDLRDPSTHSPEDPAAGISRDVSSGSGAGAGAGAAEGTVSPVKRNGEGQEPLTLTEGVALEFSSSAETAVLLPERSAGSSAVPPQPPAAKSTVPEAKGSPAGKFAALLTILAVAAGAGAYANRDTLFPASAPAGQKSSSSGISPVPGKSITASVGNSVAGKSGGPGEAAPSPEGTFGIKPPSTRSDPGNSASAAASTVNAPPVPPTLAPSAPETPAAAITISPDAAVAAAPAAAAATATATAPPPKTPLGRARLILESFLAAPDWQKRLGFALNPDSIRDRMAAHFKDRPDGPIPTEGISLMTNGTVPGSNRALFGFRVRITGFHADIPMAVEETENGFRVDWPPFLETYEQRLRKFFEKPGNEPGDFRVVLRRKHYFGPAVPGQDTVRQAFSVESPMRDEAWVVWIDLQSPVYTSKLAPQGATDWDTESFMIVHLEWQGDDKQGRWPSLTGVVTDNWQVR